MSMKDKAKDLMQASLGKMEKATGKVLGDEDMPAKDQVEEVKSQVKQAASRVRDALKKNG